MKLNSYDSTHSRFPRTMSTDFEDPSTPIMPESIKLRKMRNLEIESQEKETKPL